MNRLNYYASSEEEVVQYFKTRQLQLASCGYVWDNKLYKNTYGYHAYIVEEATGQQYDAFYVLKQDQGKGNSKNLVSTLNNIITIDDCHVVSFLQKIQKNHKVVKGDFDSLEYKMVEKIYGDGQAERSKAYFMNHIDEGLIILNKINATEFAKNAFCLHPLTQMDKELSEHLSWLVIDADPYSLALSLEYRNIANQYLSKRTIKSLDDIVLSPLKEVNDMLIADKIQNYKDFLLYHKDTHLRSKELDQYFNNWLDKLDCRETFNWFIDYSKQFQQTVEVVLED
jgi:hypothetical protein